MTEYEYKEMYTEFAFESGSGMSDKGFEEFKAWRKKVEELFKVRLTDKIDEDSSWHIPLSVVYLGIMRNNEELNEMMNPVINVGTEKNPMMVLCATTMVMMYEEATGKKFGDNMDDYVKYCDGYCDGYNENLDKT